MEGDNYTEEAKWRTNSQIQERLSSIAYQKEMLISAWLKM
jgi:hypothetical protein